MVEAILTAARAVMQEQGVSALTLNEVARRVQLRPQSLAEYFPSKAALYDALTQQAIALFREGDERAYRDHSPGWAQVAAWFTKRIALATEHPDLYHVMFDAPVPNYVPSEVSHQATQALLARSRHMVAEAIAAGAMDPGMPVERATDLLLSIRRGLIAEQLGKRAFVEPGSNRFDALLPEVIRILQAAWVPGAVEGDGRHPQSAAANADGAGRRNAMTD
jgi:AcrR family transcriptional regulator